MHSIIIPDHRNKLPTVLHRAKFQTSHHQSVSPGCVWHYIGRGDKIWKIREFPYTQQITAMFWGTPVKFYQYKVAFVVYKSHFQSRIQSIIISDHRNKSPTAPCWGKFPDFCFLYRYNVMHSQDRLIGGGWFEILLDGAPLAIYFDNLKSL